MTSTSDESGLERVTSAVMLVVFWVAFATLAVGLASGSPCRQAMQAPSA